MRVDILSLLPGMFGEVFDHGIVRRARQAGLLQIETHALTDWTEGRFQRADDAPYGGGPGMVMRVEPLVEAVEAIGELDAAEPRVVLLSPRGRQLDQEVVAELAREPRLLLVAGRYEGVDERFTGLTGAEEISVGDYVLSGGEVAAMVVVDAVTRLIPGAVGDSESVVQESFATGLLEHAHYPRPPVFRGEEVPPVLLSGNHQAVRRFRREQSVQLTRNRRPDLFRAFAGQREPASKPNPDTKERSS
ncbi:MAG: tRNA (guanosine(37)-N1)-methyltransferase TrmD [Acidobacteria bacterium]|nr:tRNA (guanosine(37)-N1)-methyltransferase TrmD [Acidobacteriota bacterium]